MLRPRPLLLVLVSSACVACQPLRPPTPAPSRQAIQVEASFSKTWDAVIDHFAHNNIPISTIERASGIIATDRLGVTPPQSLEYTDCGTAGFGVSLVANFVTYNALVRGDEDRATVLVTATWHRTESPQMWSCQSRGIWERETERAIKRIADGIDLPDLTHAQVAEADTATWVRFDGAPFDTPTWAGFVGSRTGQIVYPLIPSCRAWYHLREDEVRFLATLEHVRRLGLALSDADGCWVRGAFR